MPGESGMKNEANYIPDSIFFKPTKQYFVKADNDFLSSLRSTSYFTDRRSKHGLTPLLLLWRVVRKPKMKMKM